MVDFLLRNRKFSNSLEILIRSITCSHPNFPVSQKNHLEGYGWRRRFDCRSFRVEQPAQNFHNWLSASSQFPDTTKIYSLSGRIVSDWNYIIWSRSSRWTIQPKYNAAPGQKLIVIPMEDPKKMHLYKWGLVPHWAKDDKIGYRMINARAESLKEKPDFRGPLQKGRCLVIADGFYE